MKFLGKKIPKRSVFLKEALNWIEYPPYILCPTDSANEQMQCQKYKPGSTATWQCEYCKCGKSDICSA